MAIKMMKLLLLLSNCILFAQSAIDADLVTSLPGLPPGAFPNRMWSGYIDVPTVNGTAHVHYVLVENSKNDSNAPIVVWQQGGPGGSSLIGMFTEVGPLTLNDHSFATNDYAESGVPTVFPNPHSWHTAPANYLFVEHPAPTGFSYCTGDCYWNDTSQSEVNYEFYVNFFKAYPEYEERPFYFTGESYAGVLVPTVALQFLKHRTDDNRHKNPWNLQGFALGNDCPGNRVFTCTPYSGWLGTKVALDFRFGHGMISEALYAQITDACKGWWKGGKPYPDPDGPSMEGPPMGSECRNLLEDPVRPCLSKAGDTYDMGGGYFLYDTCTADLLALDNITNRPKQLEGDAFRAPAAQSDSTYTPNSGEYACGQERATLLWLNLPEVQKALHVKLVDKPQYSFSTGLHYEFTTWSLLDEYKNLLIPNFRIMQYSGDADPCVPYVGTQRWIESLDLKVESPWQPWRAPGPHDANMVAGYNTVFEHNFTFVTIRDAGHMAPRYKPTQALYMFKQFLKNEPL